MVVPPILQIGDVLISSEILTEYFCCDLAACKGQCCIEGDAGAPVTFDEIGEIEDSLDTVWKDLSAQAQAVIDRQGVAYTDEEGDLVTSIVGGKDCVFTCYDDLTDRDTGATISHCCLCALERAHRAGQSRFCKPISCALYPIREKQFTTRPAEGDTSEPAVITALNLHHWKVCECAFRKGRELQLPVYQFLKDPLVRRFGQAWYDELLSVVESLKQNACL